MLFAGRSVYSKIGPSSAGKPRWTMGWYAALDLSDRIGADSCPCAFHWLQYLLGQPRLSKNFSRGASRGPLRVRRRAGLQASFSRSHRVCDCHGQRRCVVLAVVKGPGVSLQKREIFNIFLFASHVVRSPSHDIEGGDRGHAARRPRISTGN